MITEPRLPWAFKLKAFVVSDDTALIITERQHDHHPYTLHRMNRHTGDCYYGHYYRSYTDALAALVAKLGVGNDEEKNDG